MKKPCVLRISEVERDGERQGAHSGLTSVRKRERERETHFSFVFNKFALTWETLASGDDFCDLSPSTDFVSQTLAGRSGRNRRSENHQSREASLVGALLLFADHHHQLMNDLFVTLTQIENCRRSCVLFGLRQRF